MKRGKLDLNENVVWVTLIEDEDGGEDFEVALVPSEACQFTDSMTVATAPEMVTSRVCFKAFVDFRGLETDGVATKNTVTERQKLYKRTDVRAAINGHLITLNQQALEGEGDAASD